MTFWPPTEGTLSYALTGETWTDERGAVWLLTDRICGACDGPLWVLGEGDLSGQCPAGHRCFLTDEWTI